MELHLVKEATITAPLLSQDQEEWDPPNEIVEQNVDAKAEAELLRPEGLGKADGPEDFSEKSNQDDGKMFDRVRGRYPVTESVNSDDHPHTLPQLKIIRSLHPCPVKHKVGEKHDETSPENIVNSGQLENAFIHRYVLSLRQVWFRSRSGRPEHREHNGPVQFGSYAQKSHAQLECIVRLGQEKTLSDNFSLDSRRPTGPDLWPYCGAPRHGYGRYYLLAPYLR
jgi:hypothetical protein